MRSPAGRLLRRQAARLQARQPGARGAVLGGGPCRPETRQPGPVGRQQHGRGRHTGMGQALPVPDDQGLDEGRADGPYGALGQRAAVHGERGGQREHGHVRAGVPGRVTGGGDLGGRRGPGPEQIARGLRLGQEPPGVGARQRHTDQDRTVAVRAASDEPPFRHGYAGRRVIQLPQHRVGACRAPSRPALRTPNRCRHPHPPPSDDTAREPTRACRTAPGGIDPARGAGSSDPAAARDGVRRTWEPRAVRRSGCFPRFPARPP